MSIEQPTAKRVVIGPLVPRAMRAEIVHRTRINYHVAKEEPLLTHIQQSRNLNFVQGNTPGFPTSGSGSNRKKWKRTQRKDQKWNISNFESFIFLQYTENFIILAPAGKLAGAIPKRLRFNPVTYILPQ